MGYHIWLVQVLLSFLQEQKEREERPTGRPENEREREEDKGREQGGGWEWERKAESRNEKWNVCVLAISKIQPTSSFEVAYQGKPKSAIIVTVSTILATEWLVHSKQKPTIKELVQCDDMSSQGDLVSTFQINGEQRV